MTSTWHIEDETVGRRDPEVAPAGGTMSLAFVRATLRRLWYVWVGSTVLGSALALCWLVLIPPQSIGTVTLLLAHDPTTQPDTAMATDVRLLHTRAVAQRLADELGSDESPDHLLSSILTEPATSSVLQVDINGSNPEDAVRRARLLGQTYLGYRQEQLTQQSRAATEGYRKRIAALQTQADALTHQYDLITSRGEDSQQAADVLARRGQMIGQITQLQDQIENDTLEADAVVTASRVLDQAALVPQSPLRRAVLVLGSGLIGGLMVGLGAVMVYAVTTGRLRSRADVALAMGVPVKFSAGPVAPRRRRGERDAAALDLLVDGLETALPAGGKPPRRLGLISVDCEREGAKVLAGLARRLGTETSVLAVDLARTGLLAQELGSPASAEADAEAEETAGWIAVVTGPTVDAVADVMLSLTPFEIGRGLGHVKSTSSRCVVLVKAGRSTTERLNTVARAARAAGLTVEFVMVVGADKSDQSFGGDIPMAKAQPAT
ncbi:hypothetical protein [Nocardioides panaciterrulae]|uniref:Capsular polysaccharide biosynthesis protein n=1 Tax=Nocardioides panaciterrulae TaxID=661492 RepID=A0A7Y9JDA1_9ACTN|nr:hypothetical protein [Nocardioides panaciterrulae]NYD43074.1 capsular polysaccharide biosynthesis protein [Nocardioides panaciterrulae]